MHVERYGHGGAAVLLVHGFGTCSFLWRDIAPEFALANRTAFAVDLFGYGESDRPFDADFSIAAQAEYLDRALTALRVARATIVGVDLGAAITLRLAATRPERVERMILINPIAYDDVPAKDVKDLQKHTGRYALRISRGILGAAPLMRDLLRQSVADPSRMPDKLVARYLAPYVGSEGLNHLLILAAFQSEVTALGSKEIRPKLPDLATEPRRLSDARRQIRTKETWPRIARKERFQDFV